MCAVASRPGQVMLPKPFEAQKFMSESRKPDTHVVTPLDFGFASLCNCALVSPSWNKKVYNLFFFPLSFYTSP